MKKRTIFSRVKVLFGALLLAGMLVASCNPEPPVDPRDPGKPPCGEPNKPPREEPPREEPPREEPGEPGKCAETGTLVKVICGTSLFSDYWIKPDNGGDYIVPCQSDAGTPMNAYEGMRVAYSYTPINGPCNSRSTCKAYAGPSVNVLITCLMVETDNHTGGGRK